MQTHEPRCPKCEQLGSKVSGLFREGFSAFAPPREPEFPFGSGKLWVRWTKLLNGLCSLAIIGAVVVFLYQIASVGKITRADILCLTGFELGAIFWLFLGLRDVRVAKSRKELYEKNHSRWHKAMGRWNQLFYCRVHDEIFIPGEDKVAPASEILNFVYKGL